MPGSAAAASPAGRERRRGGPCFAAVGREGSAHKRRPSLRSTAPVGALAERVVVTPAPPEERAGTAPPEPHPQSVAARAVVTVRRRRKEDAKRRVAEQLDAYADRVGRSVLLELISTETDPSKKHFFRDPTSTTPTAAAAAARRHGIPWRIRRAVALHL